MAFRFHLELIGGNRFDVYVEPKSGFYGFLVATSVSLVLGHVMVYLHRHAEIDVDSNDLRLDSLFNHDFDMTDGSSKRLSGAFKKSIVVILFSVIVILVVGITEDTFVFEFGGLAGLALGEERLNSYSLISLGASIPNSIEQPATIAIYLLQVAFYFYAVITPFAALFFLLIILLAPLTLQQQFLILTLAEIANAWSAIEVFVLSVIAAVFQISTFASFIIGHRCDIINSILNEYSEDDSITCYTVKATLTWKASFLLLGVIFNSCWASFVLRLAHTAIHERILRNEASVESSDASIVGKMAAFYYTAWIVESDECTELLENETIPAISEGTFSLSHVESRRSDKVSDEANDRFLVTGKPGNETNEKMRKEL